MIDDGNHSAAMCSSLKRFRAVGYSLFVVYVAEGFTLG